MSHAQRQTWSNRKAVVGAGNGLVAAQHVGATATCQVLDAMRAHPDGTLAQIVGQVTEGRAS